MRNEHKKNWKWKPKRWWIGLILFSFISISGAGVIARNAQYRGQEGGFIVMTMLIFAIGSACTERCWSIPKRVVWIIAVWIMHALFSTAAIIPTGLIANLISKPQLLETLTSFLGAFPLVIWAMRRSKFFVEPAVKKDGPVHKLP